MRSRKRTRRRAIAGGIVALVVLIVAASMLIPDYGDNLAQAEPVGQQAANRIAQQNDNAAATAAAAMRARSAQAAGLADQAQDQRDRVKAAQPAH